MAFVAALADTVDYFELQVPGRTWRRRPGVDNSRFEEEQHQLGRPGPGVASRPSHGQHSGLDYRLEGLRLPWRLGCSDHHHSDDVPTLR